MASTTELTPQERLAISRKAIVRHMNRDHRVPHNDDSQDFGNAEVPRRGLSSTWDTVKHALLVWWHRHPASAAIDLARPMMDDYAESHPFKLLGVSAGVGAAIVLVRPWRMMSLGGLLVAALKSSGLSSVLMSLLSKPRQKSETTHPSNKP